MLSITVRLVCLMVVLSGFAYAQEPRLEVPSTLMDAASRIRNFVPNFLKTRPGIGMFRKVLGFGKTKKQVESSMTMTPSELQGYQMSANQEYYYPQMTSSDQASYPQMDPNGGSWPGVYQNAMYQQPSSQPTYGSEVQQPQYVENGRPDEMSQQSQFAANAQPQEQNYPGYYQQSQQYAQQSNSMQGYMGQNAEQNNQFNQGPMQAQNSEQYQVAYQGSQQDGQYQESAPYPMMASSNPSKANMFHSRPYGPHPGTIDVHQVLDQFIRSAGLSPQGDHENVKGDNSFAASGTKPVFTLKKLYSYPFFINNKGEPTGYRRRESVNEGNDASKLVSQQFVNHVETMQKYLNAAPKKASVSS